MPLPRPPSALLILLGSALVACGGSKSDESEARRIEDPAELAEMAKAAEAKPGPKPSWKRDAPRMPETFVAFKLPDLAALDGAWVVESEIPGRRALWLIEEAGSKLTEIDHRGRERVYGLALASPCGLRLTDEQGQSRSRAIAVAGDALVLTRRGATGLVGKDGSMLACVGHRTYQISTDGRCRYTTEMLGSWTDPVAAEQACVRTDEQLSVADRVLRPIDGMWLDEKASRARALAVADRETGIAELAKPMPKPEPEPTTEPEPEQTTEPATEPAAEPTTEPQAPDPKP